MSEKGHIKTALLRREETLHGNLRARAELLKNQIVDTINKEVESLMYDYHQRFLIFNFNLVYEDGSVDAMLTHTAKTCVDLDGEAKDCTTETTKHKVLRDAADYLYTRVLSLKDAQENFNSKVLGAFSTGTSIKRDAQHNLESFSLEIVYRLGPDKI